MRRAAAKDPEAEKKQEAAARGNQRGQYKVARSARLSHAMSTLPPMETGALSAPPSTVVNDQYNVSGIDVKP